jgi:beta-phosphoglucomutase-like phosphatase (HAD superfamily)
VDKTRLTLGLTGLIDLFEPTRVFSAAIVDLGKPAPDLFLHAAGVCGRDPASCIVVEDRVGGIVAARTAGMRVLAYGAGGDPDALAEAGAEVFFDMREIPARASRV